MISIIAVIGENRAIGRGNKLLWNIPDDMKRFKKLTSGHPVIMGRKTAESLFVFPLPNRINIVITRNENFKINSGLIANSLKEAIKIAKKSNKDNKENNEIFIIGGGQIYTQALPYADKLYLTIVKDKPKNADTFFPDYSEFNKILKQEKKEYKKLKYKFVELIK